jgi:hypothetical protein
MQEALLVQKVVGKAFRLVLDTRGCHSSASLVWSALRRGPRASQRLVGSGMNGGGLLSHRFAQAP